MCGTNGMVLEPSWSALGYRFGPLKALKSLSFALWPVRIPLQLGDYNWVLNYKPLLALEIESDDWNLIVLG